MNMESGMNTKNAASVLYLEQDQSEFITIDELIAVFFKRLGVILLLAALVFVTVIAYHKFLLQDSYTSTASLSLASDSGSMNDSRDLSRELVQSEIQIIQSEIIAKRVVDRLKLHHQEKWIAPLSRVGGKENERNERMYFEAALQKLISAISVEAFGRSFVIKIKGNSTDPDEAATIANAVANAYLNWRKDNYSDGTNVATSLKEQRIDELASALRVKEQELADLRSTSGILSGAGPSIAEQKIRQAENAFSDARLIFQERDLDYNRAVASNGSWSRLLSNALVEDTDVLNQLRSQQIILAQEMKELSTQYGNRHPDVVAKQAEISELEQRLVLEAASIVEGLRARRDAARSRMSNAENNLEQVKAELRANSNDIVRIGSIEREISTLRSQYDRYVDELAATTENQVIFEDTATLLSEAVPPLYSNKPSLMMFVGIASILGLLAGIGGAVLLELLDDKFYGASSVWAKLNKRAIASVPKLKQSELNLLTEVELRTIAGYAVAKPMSAFSESLRVILSSITENNTRDLCHVISVTSSVPGEGKSTLSTSLGRVAAISGLRVLLIDCDIRRRMTATISGISVELGILDVVMGKCAWKEATYRDKHSMMDVIPATQYQAENGEQIFNLNTGALENLLDEIKQHYDIVILDGPPVLAMADALGLARIADTNLMVIRSCYTGEKAVQTAIRQIGTVAKSDNIAIVLNCVLKGRLGRVSYDDSLYYGYAEKNYYND